MTNEFYSHVLQRVVQPDEQADLTYAQREYLSAIYRLQVDADEYVQTNALAEMLSVSPPAIVKMIRRLVCDGYLEREPYRGVLLTQKGRTESLLAIRRHRILEVFLMRVMGFGWHEVGEQAKSLEVAITDRLEQRMFLLGGEPTHCPHGEPIPDSSGTLPPITDVSLATLSVGTTGIISRIRHHTPEKLEYLAAHNILPSKTFTIKGRAPFNGPVRLLVEGQEVVLGSELAGNIWVTIQTEEGD